MGSLLAHQYWSNPDDSQSMKPAFQPTTDINQAGESSGGKSVDQRIHS